MCIIVCIIYICNLCLLIQPGVIAKALQLSGFHFEDVWKSSMLTEDMLSEVVARFNIFYVEVYGISELLRKVPTFVSAHTFGASRKVYSKRD